MLEDIVKRVGVEGESFPIPVSEVRRWMSSTDIEALGATYQVLVNPRLASRIDHTLPFDEVFDFILRYYESCITTDPKGEWSHPRYIAGGELVSFFVSLWDEKRDEKYFYAIKSLIEKLYLMGDAEVKKAIVHATVEHLFEREAIREFFSDWRERPDLRSAYEEGMMWVKGGGRSPLTETRGARQS